MVDAATDAGLDGVGITDHCNVSPDPAAERFKRTFGFNLDLTYERRREAIERLRADPDVGIDVFDAVEMDYDPDHEAAIADFLAEAGFDYAIGSVHERTRRCERPHALALRRQAGLGAAGARRPILREAGRADRFRAVRDRRASGFGRA